jgi:hypothetical protein
VTLLNQCGGCEQDFASLAAFDEHILSKPSDPLFDCMTVEEMETKDWARSDKGRWTSPRLKAQAEALATARPWTTTKPVEAREGSQATPLPEEAPAA